MRILLVHQYFLEENDPGGSRFNEMTKYWTDQSCDVTVLAGMIHANGFKKKDEYRGEIFVNKKQGNVNVWRCHVSESYNKNFAGRLWGYFSFIFSSVWAGIFKVKGKYDVILVTSPPLFVGITGLFLSWFKRTPLVFEIRDLWPESAIETGVVSNKLLIKLSYWLEKTIYRKSRLINVLTPAFRSALIEKKSVPSGKIVFIPNAADFSLSDKLLKDFDYTSFRKEKYPKDSFIITYVGAHGVANHLIQLLDAADQLKDTQVLFQLIGDGMEKKILMEEAQKRGLVNIIFIDSVPKAEVFKYILASDVGTSVLKKVDTFKTIYSNKTFDYMACKKPVLLLIDGVSRDLIEEANCGVYAEPENIEDIVSKIHYLINNKKNLSVLGENGYNFAKNKFERATLAKKYLNYLESVT